MKVFPKMIQGSEAWYAVRKGRPTASRFKDVITAAKAEYSKSATGYMQELIADCFTTDVEAWTGNKWTDRGTELEPEARKAYGEHTGREVEEVGFCAHDNEFFGCSPDGLILDPVTLEYCRGVEIKCLAPKGHVAAVAGGVLPDDYKAQVHGSLYVTGLPAWDFWSYCPGMRPFLVTVRPDEYTVKLGAALERFAIEYAALRAAIIPQLKLTA